MQPTTYNTSSPNDLQAIFDRIPTVPNQAIQADEKTSGVPNMAFVDTAGQFWRYHDNGKCVMSYVAGKIAGTYNTKKPSTVELFAIYMAGIKNLLSTLHTTEEDIDATTFEPYLKNLQLANDMLNNKILADCKNKIDTNEIFAYVHGMLNTFIECNIKNK